MKSDLDEKLKYIEKELTDLKTASEYSSVRSAAVTYSQLVYTGTYKITYENKNEPIFSLIHTGIIADENDLGGARPRTPQNNIQYVDVFTSYMDLNNQEVTKTTTLVVVSNLAVKSIERI